jgi:hypothetical protein
MPQRSSESAILNTGSVPGAPAPCRLRLRVSARERRADHTKFGDHRVRLGSIDKRAALDWFAP